MIGIINYGLGNIRAFENIYRRLHVPVKILTAPHEFEGVTRLILPGVGAFDQAMERFNNSGMRAITEEYVLAGKTPVIGICVGMQMLAHASEEGVLPGLGWIPGRVRKFDESQLHQATHLPHMGWNDVQIKPSSIFTGFDKTARFYFLHSYYFECLDQRDVIASTTYGIEFASAVARENIFGVQFHPEKSHDSGVALLHNFAKN